MSSPPPKSDHTVAPAWALTIGHAMYAYSQINPTSATPEIIKAWKSISSFLESSDTNTRTSASTALTKVAQSFSAELIAQKNSPVQKIVAQVGTALESVAYARAIPEVLSVITALVWNLRHRASKTGPTAAEQLLIPLIKRISELRIQKTFEYKEAADVTLGMAMHVMGPHVVLEALPLNLEPGTRKPGEEPKAFLLPLLSQSHPSPLAHFIRYFVPLSEKMFDLQQTAESSGRQSEAKVWNVLMGQVWSGLVGYCWGTPDLKEVCASLEESHAIY